MKKKVVLIWLISFLQLNHCEYVGKNCDDQGPDYVFDSCVSYFTMRECPIILDDVCLQENPCFCAVQDGYVPTQFPCETFECLWVLRENSVAAAPINITETEATPASATFTKVSVTTSNPTDFTITSKPRPVVTQNPFVKTTTASTTTVKTFDSIEPSLDLTSSSIMITPPTYTTSSKRPTLSNEPTSTTTVSISTTNEIPYTTSNSQDIFYGGGIFSASKWHKEKALR